MAFGTKDLAPSELDGFDDEKLVAELEKSKKELFNLASSRPPASWRATVGSRLFVATSRGSTRSSASVSSASVPHRA